jgi:hypothetical protein
MAKDDSLPPFLHGAFDWNVDGYQWNGDPPFDLRTPETLKADNPWMVVASVVEHAKAGDHEPASRLIPFFTRTEPFALRRVALQVFADVAPGRLVGSLVDALAHADPEVRKAAGEASKYVGRLSLIPPMLEAWQRALKADDHETIGFAISEVLETTYGALANAARVWDTPIAEGPPSVVGLPGIAVSGMDDDDDPPGFPDLVKEAHRQLVERYGRDAYVWRGEPTSVAAMARALLDKASATTPAPGAIIVLRHRFEAATGIDCRGFFYAMRPRPKQIQRVVEAFLDSDAPSRYLPGTRYFFGKPIPE